MKNKKMKLKIDIIGKTAWLFVGDQLAILFELRDQSKGVFEPIPQSAEYEDLLLKNKDFQWRLESILLYLKSYQEDYSKLALRRSIIEDICEQLLK